MDQQRIVIESVTPQVDCGRFAVKAVAGDRVRVGADIWKDGHERLKAHVLWRRVDPEERAPFARPGRPDLGRRTWRQAPLESRYEYNDRWYGELEVDDVGPWAFTVAAWTDVFGSWREELRKWWEAHEDVRSSLLEGLALVERALARARPEDRSPLAARLAEIRAAKFEARRVELALDPALAQLMDRNDPRADLTSFERELPLWVDRERARFGAWYEIFVRSQGGDATRPATFREAEARLPAIAAMGFDTLYLTPIHPIGTTCRKGPNNSVVCQPGDPGSPWAIGSPEGGHDAVDPALGTLADFEHFRDAAAHHGLELALDFALQCSPDHPWVRAHPQWFAKRPDGSIKYAENPPKKYQDIYPIDFETEDREGLYAAILGLFETWIGRGVKIFRVDNPHTKPVSFWEWLIESVHRRHPDVIFLAEAFTRPKRMRYLAKAGFTQSYTYFTWRNTRAELEEYAGELFLSDVRDTMRPNFFANTPDILHEILQKGGRPAFIQRLVLAATLSPSYGIYNGFELCENRPLQPGSEEYLDSEKYQIRVWDWERPGNIVPVVTLVNRIRRQHPALQRGDSLRILPSTDEHLFAYAKTEPEVGDVLVMVVNTDPLAAHEGMVDLPAELCAGRATVVVEDLLTGGTYPWWRPGPNYVRLDPIQGLPAHILHVLP